MKLSVSEPVAMSGIGLRVGALRAQSSSLNYRLFLPAKPAFYERVRFSQRS